MLGRTRLDAPFSRSLVERALRREVHPHFPRGGFVVLEAGQRHRLDAEAFQPAAHQRLLFRVATRVEQRAANKLCLRRSSRFVGLRGDADDGIGLRVRRTRERARRDAPTTFFDPVPENGVLQADHEAVALLRRRQGKFHVGAHVGRAFWRRYRVKIPRGDRLVQARAHAVRHLGGDTMRGDVARGVDGYLTFHAHRHHFFERWRWRDVALGHAQRRCDQPREPTDTRCEMQLACLVHDRSPGECGAHRSPDALARLQPRGRRRLRQAVRAWSQGSGSSPRGSARARSSRCPRRRRIKTRCGNQRRGVCRLGRRACPRCLRRRVRKPRRCRARTGA
jgi:hypothetical protein